MGWYAALIALVTVERLAELVVANRNRRIMLARGGIEYGQGHYRLIVALHTGLLAGALAEVYLADRPFYPWLGYPMLAVVLAAQGLRWWCIRTLGPQWNTRVIVVPGMPLVTGGPYRWLRHPNYVAVVAEGVALPLVHTAWLTATLFTALNLPLLWWRIRVEDRALGRLAASPS
ncbi:MAG TPA: isoprenylcysteine carboxyl methyltransferase family protein [Actinomycetes bacterium]|nr:isoprenylcysteine carboxyl methyltransferase family protein [Actinomycetes bacterium]